MDDDEFKSEADFYMSVKGKALSIGQVSDWLWSAKASGMGS
jgi:phosphotransferase system IIA component